MRIRLALASAFTVAVCVRTIEVLRADALSRLVDDSYMYFDTARTLGATGHLATSGIQALYTLLCAPVYFFLHPQTLPELDTAARICVGIGALGDVVTMGALCYLLWRASGPLAAAIGAWVWALHPAVIGFSVNGLETSWALAGLLGVVIAFEYGRRDWLTGAAVAFAMLCRVDLAAAGAVVGLLVLWQGRDDWAVTARRVGKLAIGWSVVYLPWLAFLYLQTGDVIPVSGAASHFLGLETRAAYNASGGPDYSVFMVAIGVTRLLYGAPLVALAALLLSPFAKLRPYRVLLGHCGIAFAYYIGYHDVWWYADRYLAPMLVLEVLVAASGLAALLSRNGMRRWVPMVASVALVACATLHYRVTVPDEGTLVTGYYEAARGFAEQLPANMVIAAPESGALSYYLPRRVINADGVVNRAAYDAIRAHGLSEYVRAMGADYFVSCPDLRARIGMYSAHPVPYHVEEPTFGRFSLYAIDWPERASR